MRDDEALVVRGHVVDDDRDTEIESLRADNQRLRRDLTIANGEIARAKSESARAMGSLRKQLSPLYRALQSVFGELDAAGAAEEPSEPSAGGRDAREMAQWNDWKAKLPPPCVKVIDALLLHNDLTVKQLKVAARLGENSVYQATSRLGQAGLVTKNGGRFSLKQL